MKKWIIISFGGFYLTWALNLLLGLPYLFYFNTAFIAWLVLEAVKEKTLLIIAPLFILRLSQLLNIQGKYLMLISMCVIFILILGYLLIYRKKTNVIYLILSVIAYTIEVFGYLT
ncbi:hypothetical protein [Ekhidna sp.]|uniref:hypothetical protein n=1 Tax=Ekhidna sp. TaxID=2608089 RepID=UPI0032EF24CF